MDGFPDRKEIHRSDQSYYEISQLFTNVKDPGKKEKVGIYSFVKIMKLYYLSNFLKVLETAKQLHFHG